MLNDEFIVIRHLLLPVVILLVPFAIFGQSFGLDSGIDLTEENRPYSIALGFDGTSEVRSPYGRGTVTRFSGIENNPTRLGRFVEIEYNMGFDFEGSFLSQGRMRIIFSNLGSVSVDQDSVIDENTLIGVTKSGSDNELRIFVISDTDDLQFLKMWTNDRKILVGDTWYWDPSYLVR